MAVLLLQGRHERDRAIAASRKTPVSRPPRSRAPCEAFRKHVPCVSKISACSN